MEAKAVRNMIKHRSQVCRQVVAAWNRRLFFAIADGEITIEQLGCHPDIPPLVAEHRALGEAIYNAPGLLLKIPPSAWAKATRIGLVSNAERIEKTRYFELLADLVGCVNQIIPRDMVFATLLTGLSSTELNQLELYDQEQVAYALSEASVRLCCGDNPDAWQERFEWAAHDRQTGGDKWSIRNTVLQFQLLQ